jgi:hypothetical protein
MRTNRIAAMLTLGFAASAASAAAGVTAHIGGAIGAGASVGAPGASLSISAPATIGAGANGLGSSASGNAQGAFGANAAANRGSLSAVIGANASGVQTATVSTIANGMVTLTAQNGAVVSVPMTQAQMQSLNLRNGTHLALTRMPHGIVLTNLDTLHSLTGRGVVRSVRSNAVTFVNRTGTHTISLAHDAIARLGLHRGSTIMVSATNVTQLAVAATSAHR